jgi:hypothetical protein
LEVYNHLGQLVRRVIDRDLPAGVYSASIQTAGLAPGIYVYRATTPDATISRQMVIIR